MKTLKIVLWVLVIGLLFAAFINYSAEQDKKVMSINYCWDSNGDHYVAPNEACRN